MEGSQSLLRAPVEDMARIGRTAYTPIHKDLQFVVAAVEELNKRATTHTPQQICASIDKLLGRLSNLKRKLDEVNKEEEECIRRSKARLEHLKSVTAAEKQDQRRWRNIKLDRLVVDHMLREGYYDSALLLSKESNIEDLVDMNVFLTAKKVMDSLRQGDCTEALKWCNENKARLKKIDVSPFCGSAVNS